MAKMMKPFVMLFNFCFFISVLVPPLHASEVIENTQTRVVRREHPKTEKPYVSIVPMNSSDDSAPIANYRRITSRPDYRMLDPKIKSGQIPYDGPFSDATKVYVFAATLATLGTVGGAVGLATLPATTAATGVAASGGSAYLAAGGAVAATGAAGVTIATKSDSENDDFTQISKSKSVERKQEKGVRVD